jgi:hypothetical protein
MRAIATTLVGLVMTATAAEAATCEERAALCMKNGGKRLCAMEVTAAHGCERWTRACSGLNASILSEN